MGDARQYSNLVSNQISTADYEASRTSNMKFMMNAALTVGTRDGVNIEMAGQAGPLRETLLTHAGCSMHLADLKSYCEAQERLGQLYTDPDAWARKAILNVAGSGKFSSDRTIAEYAADIWKVKPCPVV